MLPKEENKSLIKEPLPANLSALAKIVPINYSMVGKDRVLASIIEIDEQGAQVQDLVAPFYQYMQKQREALMKRAQDENITTDSVAMLVEVEGRKSRNDIEDLEAFELQFPGALEKIRADQERKIKLKYDRDIKSVPDSSVPLTVADEIVGKNEVTEFVGYKPVVITYEVRKV